jgi:lincosamide nucleotidyltransferase A/C/D/E
MNSKDVIDLYKSLQQNGIRIWIDGGWCVDALLGKQTREHPDLDIAVDKKDADNLKNQLLASGYSGETREDTSEWNYAVRLDDKLVDVHVFEFDDSGKNRYGINYPKESLTGKGSIGGNEVECISPEWMFKFKTAYKPKPKDLEDIKVLAEKFNFVIPTSHLT